MLVDVGVSEQEMSRITNVDNVIEFDSDLYYKDHSNIHGVGIFATKDIQEELVIGLGSIDRKYRTPLGRWTNHSDDPNARFYYTKAGDVVMVAIKNITANEEVLVDYRQHSLEKAYYV